MYCVAVLILNFKVECARAKSVCSKASEAKGKPCFWEYFGGTYLFLNVFSLSVLSDLAFIIALF